jgi:hypothetical protein
VMGMAMDKLNCSEAIYVLPKIRTFGWKRTAADIALRWAPEVFAARANWKVKYPLRERLKGFGQSMDAASIVARQYFLKLEVNRANI